MSVSPADFALYSRVTGRPMPRTPQEQMAMAPEVFKFTREFGRGQQRQEEPSVIQQIAGTLGNVALAGAGLAGAYGLARALGPETEISPVSTASTSDVGEPKPRMQRNPVYTKENYGNPVPDPTSDPDFYSEVASHDFGSPTDDGFVEPNVRIPVRREQTLNTTGNYQRIPVRREETSDITEKYTRNPVYTKTNYGNNTTPTETAIVEQPTDEIVVVDESQPAITTTQQDPRALLGEFANNLISKAQEEVDAFDQGIDWGNRLDQAASADSPLKGAAIVAGTVAEKGAKDIATRVGKDLDTAGNIVSEAVANVQKIPAAMQEVDNVIANEQMKASVMPDNKMQETTYLNPPVEGTGGVEIGIESDLSDTPQFDDTHQANEQSSIAGLNRQTGITTSSTTNLNPDFVRDQANKLQLNIPYADKVKLVLSNLSGSIANSPIAQAGDQAAKKVVRGVLRTVAGEEKFQEMAAENLREQQAERLRSMAGNEARMANVRSKYSMDYNPAAPKLPGDAIIGLNKDRFGSSAYIPTGGSDWLRDESVPASAYDVRVPREDEETPLWWEV